MRAKVREGSRHRQGYVRAFYSGLYTCLRSVMAEMEGFCEMRLANAAVWPSEVKKFVSIPFTVLRTDDALDPEVCTFQSSGRLI